METQYRRDTKHVYREIAGEHLLIALHRDAVAPMFAFTPTAASLWVVAAIGVAVGAGMYSLAVATTALVILALWPLSQVKQLLKGKADEARRLAVSLAPDHISTYCLTFEEDTKLWLKLSQGRVKLDPELEAAMYEATWAQLTDLGYAQYEISNFARPGHACLHNLNTWHMHEWIGLGPSAASQFGGWRGANIADLDRWIAHVGRGERVTEDRIALTPELLAEDALIFGLRMNAGVDLARWQERAPHAPWTAVEDTLATLVAGELVRRHGDVVQLTRRGRLVADSVGAEIMAAFEPMTETA